MPLRFMNRNGIFALLFTKFFKDERVVFRFVGQEAIRTIFDAVSGVATVTAAVRHRIQWAVAKQAVEIFNV